jgi:hypothetical protein
LGAVTPFLSPGLEGSERALHLLDPKSSCLRAWNETIASRLGSTIYFAPFSFDLSSVELDVGCGIEAGQPFWAIGIFLVGFEPSSHL